MGLELECRGGGLATTLPLQPGENYVVGSGGGEARAPDIDLARHDRAGRLRAGHAEIVVAENGDVCVTDLGSDRGTTVNGRRLTPGDSRRLALGDRIGLGRVVTCTLVRDIPAEDDPTRSTSDLEEGCMIGGCFGPLTGLFIITFGKLQRARELRRRTGRVPKGWVYLHTIVILGCIAFALVAGFIVYTSVVGGADQPVG